MFSLKKVIARSGSVVMIIGLLVVIPFLSNVHVAALPMDHSMQTADSCASYCAKNQTANPQQATVLAESETDIPVPPVYESYYGGFQGSTASKLVRAQELFRSSSFKPPDLNKLHVLFRI